MIQYLPLWLIYSLPAFPPSWHQATILFETVKSARSTSTPTLCIILLTLHSRIHRAYAKPESWPRRIYQGTGGSDDEHSPRSALSSHLEFRWRSNLESAGL